MTDLPSDTPLHVVFGTGQVGRALVARLAEFGVTVRAISQQRPATLTQSVDWRSADVTDAEAAIDAAKGASVVYQCLNAPYTKCCLLYTSPSPRDRQKSRMPSSA